MVHVYLEEAIRRTREARLFIMDTCMMDFKVTGTTEGITDRWILRFTVLQDQSLKR